MSSQKINYNLRPSKAIERKLILEVLKEGCTKKTSDEYVYVGFGAVYFNDFRLFHNELNIIDMISIEKKDSEIDRCNYNCPFKCIVVEPGVSYDVLPGILRKKKDKKSIVWLDYDFEFKPDILRDIETCAKNVSSKSFFLITIRKNLKYSSDNLEDFSDDFGDDTPDNIKKVDLEPKNHHKTIRTIFLNTINKSLSEHYASTPNENKVLFKQLFNFVYQDGAPMYTIGGMFIKQSENEEFENFEFLKLPYILQEEDAYNITFPLITNKEIHLLNSFLPNAEKSEFMDEEGLEFIPEKQKENYFDLYKYFPTYLEINNL